MKTKHNLITKALSIFLTVLLIAGSLSAGLTVIAAEYRSAATQVGHSDGSGSLKFIVPEAIYLYPNGTSWGSSTSSPFQYYVNNDENNNPLPTADSTGKIYYSYSYNFGEQEYGAKTATVSYQFVNSNLAALSGGSVTLSSSTITSGESVSITAGTSPSLAAATNGCYILWTLTLTDASDGKVKHAYALTYVYKPYVAPVGAMVRVRNQYGGAALNSYAQQITWISGAHSITGQTYASHSGNYYPNYTGDKGFSAFITAGDTAYVGSAAFAAGQSPKQGEAWTGSYAGATRYNMAFINTPASSAHFGDAANFNNSGATGWASTSLTSSTFNVNSLDYLSQEGASNKQNVFAALFATPYAHISIDTSRYSDLAQIPNLAVGLMITDDERSGSGNWYVGDYSSGSRLFDYDRSEAGTGTDNRDSYFNDVTYIIAGQGTNGWNNFGGYETEGVRYAGAWPRALINVPTGNSYVSSYDYAVKGMYSNKDSDDYAYTYAMVQLRAQQYDKSTLRAAVQRAISVMPGLGVTGISNGNITSCYFDANSSYKWTALQTAFKNAVIALTTLDSTQNPNTLATALNNALDALSTKVTVDANGGTFANGSVTYVDYPTIGVQSSINYTPTVAAPTRPFYTFAGWAGSANAPYGSGSVSVGYNNTVYATWQPYTYTMTLLPADGDTVNTETVTIDYSIESSGTMRDVLAANGIDPASFPMAREGYSFSGWTVVSADEDSNWQEGDVVRLLSEIENRRGNVTLKALWSEGDAKYTVFYYFMTLSGSYLSDNNRLEIDYSYTEQAKTNELVTIVPEDFVGFTVNTQKSRLTGTVAANGSLTLKVYYDRIPVRAEFVNYDGTVLQAAKDYLYGSSPIYTGPTPRREAANGIAYTFEGWTDGERTYTPAELASYELEKTTVFTAVYSESETLYNISISDEIGDGTVINVDEGDYAYGTTLTVSAEALDGYDASDLKLYANGEEVSNPYTFVVTEDVVFTTDDLQIIPTYIVEFFDAEGSNLTTVTVNKGADASGLVEAPEIEGYTFAFWSLPLDNVTENMKVIAQYYNNNTENYTFNFYNEETLLATLVRAEGEEFEYPADTLGTPEKEGYDFIGWTPSGFSPAAENMDVYANFIANGEVINSTLTVYYHNGSSSEKFYGDAGSVIILNYPKFAGHVFTGWTGDTAGINGETYTFGNDDAEIEATWYNLAELNAAKAEIDKILAQSSDYKDSYISRLNELKASCAELTGTVPANADELHALKDAMLEAIADAPNWLLYTLYVKVDGEVTEAVRGVKGETVTLAQPEKAGYSFNGWKVDAGTIDGDTYTFAASNAIAEATWIISAESIDALGELIAEISVADYHVSFVDTINETYNDLKALDPTDSNNTADIAELIADLNSLLNEKESYLHTYTELLDHADPTCQKEGYDVFYCNHDGCGSEYTSTVTIPTVDHKWTDWTVTKEPTLDEDGETERHCEYGCGEKETKTVSLYDASDKVVKFVTLNGVNYTVYPSGSGEGNVITSLTLYKWFSDKELRFKVNITSQFSFKAYVVFIDGVMVTPDEEGYYTVPAEETISTVTVSGVVVDENTGSGSTFWDWLMNLFRSIADFFRNLFK